MERSNPDSAAARQRLVDAECPACSMLRNEVDRTCADLLQQQCIASFVSSCRKACSDHVVTLGIVMYDNTTFYLQVTSAGYEATAGERPSPSIHESLESFLISVSRDFSRRYSDALAQRLDLASEEEPGCKFDQDETFSDGDEDSNLELE